MVASIRTVAFHGIETRPIEVQVQIASGMPAFTIVGLPDKAVAESKERVRAAMHALGLSLPPKRLTVNLAPADLSKEGSHFDLPIALGLMSAMEILPQEDITQYIVLGELGLDGSIREVNGVLPAAMHASGQGLGLICPSSCGAEAAWAGDIDILAPQNLLQLINHIKGTQLLHRPQARLNPQDAPRHPDISEVKGQETAKRALEIAAAGGHNMLMIGPPGSGKSMLASTMPGILPPLAAAEALEVSMIHSLAGTLPDGGLLQSRPFRDPHHSASLPALVGGGHKVKPGEISLAHHGVLFLDELPEFARSTLESLRQPLETGRASIARANAHITFPARFQLIAAMNPCRCGHLGDGDLECTKAPRCGADYQSKISGPMLDRIDLVVHVSAVTIADLNNAGGGEKSETIRARVTQARNIQKNRFRTHATNHPENIGINNSDNNKNSIAPINAHANGKILDDIAPLSDDARALLNKAAESAKLSARGYYRVLRVARTIADLSGAPDIIGKSHIAEALSYRRIIT